MQTISLTSFVKGMQIANQHVSGSDLCVVDAIASYALEQEARERCVRSYASERNQ